jgi:hypothetical protein
MKVYGYILGYSKDIHLFSNQPETVKRYLPADSQELHV